MSTATILAYLALTTVNLSPTDTCLRATYQLEKTVTEFAFTERAAPQRALDWIATDDAMSFDGSTIKQQSGEPFDQFELCANPDQRFFNRRYIAIDRVGGSGWILFLPAFAAADGPTSLLINGFDEAAVFRLNNETLPATTPAISITDGNQLLYIGPSEYIYEGPAVVVAGEEIPKWLSNHLQTGVNDVVEGLTERLNIAPTHNPTLFVTYKEVPDRRSWKGGVMDHGTIAIRLRGIPIENGNLEIADELTNMAAHEAVHLWLGDQFDNTQNNEQPWVHEGAAEYLADRLWMQPGNFIQEAEKRLNDCLLNLGKRGLDGQTGYVQDVSVYDCGFVIQLLAETAGPATNDIFELWRTVLDQAKDNSYDPEDFLRAARERGGAKFSQPAQRFLIAADSKRWDGLAKELTSLGIIATPREPGKSERRQLLGKALIPVMQSLCNGKYSWSTKAGGLATIHAKEECGAELKGDVTFSHINGVSIGDRTLSAFSAIQKSCAKNNALAFTLEEEPVARIEKCSATIDQLPTLFKLESIPDLFNDSRDSKPDNAIGTP